MTDWKEWHKAYDQADSSLARRLTVVRRYIADTLYDCPPGPIRAISICAGEGRDLLGVLSDHERGANVTGRLVEWDPDLAERARLAAPPGIEIVCGDAGQSAIYAGAVPANLVLCCGVFGNISDEDIRTTIHAWPMLCAPGATVIWTRGGGKRDIRSAVRQWVIDAGFEELAFTGAPETFGVGVARMIRPPEPLRSVRLFAFV